MNTSMSSMSQEQLARFAMIVKERQLMESSMSLVELGRTLVHALSESVADDKQTLVYVRLDTPNNHLAKDMVMGSIYESGSRRNPPQVYVARRYEAHDQKFRDQKLPQIVEKVRLCECAGIEV